jgi:hypothetical protein
MRLSTARRFARPARSIAAAAALAAAVFAPSRADAFCGFYVAPGDQPLVNDATQVALMREGNRTVISMSNNYKGPAADFAMVVPVPVVLQKENVKTLPHDLFQKLERLSAPRLVEYWEQDPCAPPVRYEAFPPPTSAAMPMAEDRAVSKGYGVKVEARFAVGEYEIVILSATESDGLERWLVDNKYNIPKGASAALAPYIKEQQKFFVAKVNIHKVAIDGNGVATLSPLRFHYDSNDFRLPVRLGLLNAQAKQDLLIFVVAPNQRYEVANYPNVFIPTNLDVADDLRKSFSPFYASLFDATIAKAGGRAVVTEYAWETSYCDPCPSPPLEGADVQTLGADVLPSSVGGLGPGRGGYYGEAAGMVLTRLHVRYDQHTLTEDLVFRAAGPVVGGREINHGAGGLEHGARPDGLNNFQARYAIRHPWTGPIACANPIRGRWGGPPAGVSGDASPAPAMNLASAPRGELSIAANVKRGLDDPESYDRALAQSRATSGGDAVPPVPPHRACGCEIVGADARVARWAGVASMLAMLGAWFTRRRGR